MVNIERLKEAMRARNVSYEDAAKQIGMDRATFFRRLAKNGETFTVREVAILANLLSMPSDEMEAIFFDRKLA